MKTWLAVGVLGALVFSGTARAQTSGSVDGSAGQPSGTDLARTDDTTKKTLQALYDRCVTATKKRDESVLAGLHAKDFSYKEANGKTYTRDQIETSERRALSQIATIEKINSSVEGVKLETGKTTATVHQSFRGTVLDAQNKPHPMTIDLTTRDTWLPARDGWKLQSVQVVSQEETRDGKPFDPNAVMPNANNREQNINSSNNGSNRSNGYYGGNSYRSPGYRHSIYHVPVIHVPHISAPHVPRTHRHTKKR